MPAITIAFLGPCHTTGYDGVPPSCSFPEVAGRMVEASRPGLEVHVITEPFYHPVDLPAAVLRALRRRPAVVVIEVVGWLAVSGSQSVDLSRLPRGVRSTYDRVRHFRALSARVEERWPSSAGLVARIGTGLQAIAGSPLRGMVPRLPRPALEDYEAILEEALRTLATAGGVQVVLQGPGVLNDGIDGRGLPADAIDRYRDVHGMARRLAERHHALFVDRLDAGLPLPLGAFYQPGSIRPSRAGHHAWGQLVAQRLMAAGLV